MFVLRSKLAWHGMMVSLLFCETVIVGSAGDVMRDTSFCRGLQNCMALPLNCGDS